jgi:hypothetical protein
MARRIDAILPLYSVVHLLYPPMSNLLQDILADDWGARMERLRPVSGRSRSPKRRHRANVARDQISGTKTL